LRILFIQPYVSFPGVVSDKLPGQLAKRGHEVVVLTFSGKKEKLPLLLRNDQVLFYSADALSISIPNFIVEFPYFLSLEKIVKEVQPDIIHINNLPFLTTFQSTRVAKKTHRKSIVHVHGVRGGDGILFSLAQNAYIYVFARSIFGKADKVICLTSHDAARIRRFGCLREKIRIIPNGVDASKFYPFGDEEPNLLLWCGRFTQQKGLEYLVQALRIIVAQNPRVRLLMTGDGPLLPRICRILEKYKLTDKVVLLGRVPYDAIPTLMNKASVYVLPSLNEGMPYVLLEAMACGKSVIGSDISGINDVITHGRNGLLVPPRNPVAFADAVSALLENESLRKEFGRNARQLMVEKYNWEAIAKQVEEVYAEAITEV
jgi:glycosyltransferase involved in cell wall biosynthesis